MVFVAGVLAISGCVSTPIESSKLSPGASGEALSARTLADESLHQYIVQNLGHDLPSWPMISWDFETLKWVAFYYNPSLALARAQWQTARSSLKNAAERPNPSLTLTPGYNSTKTPGVSPWLPMVNFDFLFETREKRKKRSIVQEYSTEAARQDVFAVAWKIRSDLRTALINLAVAERRKTLTTEQTEFQEVIVDAIKAQQKAGSVSAVEVSAARVALLRSEAAEADAERQVPIARSRVAQILGLPAMALTELQPTNILESQPKPLSSAELQAARRLSLQSRPDILSALARYDSSAAVFELEVAKHHPDVHLMPGYQYDQGSNKWTLGYSFEIPLFHGVNTGPIEEADSIRREAMAKFVETQALVIAAIDDAAAMQSATVGQVTQFLKLEAELKVACDSARIRFEQGATDNLETVSAKIEHTIAELSLLDAEAAAALATGQLEDALEIPSINLSAFSEKTKAIAQPSIP